jgi:DNA-binding NtrC family response regulator
MTERASLLLVDDEPALLEGLKGALRKEPFDIVTATSAAQGLEVLAERPVDVVVSDERMPGMCGSEFLAVVRRRYPDTIRIVLTGQASLEAAIRAINEGEIYRFLLKPCQAADLAMTIRGALQLRKLARESARLLVTARERHAQLVDLERQHPGITEVDRAPDGAIVLEPVAVDVDALIAEIEDHLGR